LLYLAYVLEVLKLLALVICDYSGLLPADGLDVGQFLQLDFHIVQRNFQLFVKTAYRDKLSRRVELLLVHVEVLLKDLLLILQTAHLFESLVLHPVNLLLCPSCGVHCGTSFLLNLLYSLLSFCKLDLVAALEIGQL